jgi:hypothetical protein
MRERARELRDRTAASLAIVEPETYIPTPIPFYGSRLANLSAGRRRAFRRALIRLVRAANDHDVGSSPDEIDPSPAPKVQAVLDRACALCQGFCCNNGGDHAYLTEETVRHYWALYPGQRPRDVFAAYLRHLGTETIDGSCIFHGADGCQLPREKRSHTCNRYFCQELVDFQGSQTPQTETRGFFATVDGNEFRSAAFCDENGSIMEP